ncbi:MAG: Error-prone repair protein ImuA [Bacteroidia bacterium]
MKSADRTIIEQLQKQIIQLEKRKPASGTQPVPMGLGKIESAFPDKVFPTGVIHELISYSSEEAVSTSGFMSVVLSKLLEQGGYCLWISTIPRRSIFPPALKSFGIEPGRILFVDTSKPKETLWSLEEALKCDALVAVVGELTELSFKESRQLQLAVENSHVTGFIHRFRPKSENAVACVTRWKISPIASVVTPHTTGVGFPAWNVQLTKVRSGKPGSWQIQYTPKGLEYIIPEKITVPHIRERQTG